jgi:hypothetical protein
VLAAALVASDATGQDSAAHDLPIRPFVHCVESLAGSRIRAHWGYFNRTKSTLTRALGADNRATGQLEGEPPSQFQPGFVLQAFNTVFDAAETSTWSLDGVAASADKRSHACSPAQRSATPAELIHPAPGTAMFLGANFWSLKWQPAAEYFLPQANFASEQKPPWQPALLQELAPYRVLRFMDWNLTNDATNPQSNWSTRQPPGQAPGEAVAYEWQIDLCNRAQKDYWLTVPHAAAPEYFAQLAQLVSERLDPRLRVYVEWSNEVWNGSFPQHGYARAKGSQLRLPGKDPGMAYQVHQSLRLFEAFARVFGDNNPRVVRVLAGQAAWDGPCRAQLAALRDPTINPKHTQAHVYAIAPYVYGNTIADLRSNGMTQAKDWVGEQLACAQSAGLPLIAYEGGQDSFELGQAGCERLQRDPGMRALYASMPDALAAAGLRGPFVHYTHSGSCWGLKLKNGDSVESAPKYQGLLDWLNRSKPPKR